MSTWTDFRDKVEAVGEAVIDPVVNKGITFLHDVETLVEQQGPGDVETALGDGSAAFVAAAGTIEARLLAGLIAFGSAVLGYAITIGKEAIAEVKGDAVAPAGTAPATTVAAS